MDEVHAAARMHFEFFGGPEVARSSFLKLGPEFLEAAFYRLNLDNPYFFVLGAFLRGELIGLQVFTTDRRKMFEHLLRTHRGEFLVQFLQAFVRRPISSCRYLLDKVSLKHDVPPHVQRVPAALLLMLVRPEARTKSFICETGIWVGGALLEAMEAVMRERGCPEYWSETTVDNSFVHNLARRVGAICVGEALRQGVLLRFMVAPVRNVAAAREASAC